MARPKIIRKQHPALPAETGWFLYHQRVFNSDPAEYCWRVGYRGEAHANAARDFATEEKAIAWLHARIRKVTADAKTRTHAQRVLYSAWGMPCRSKTA